MFKTAATALIACLLPNRRVEIQASGEKRD